jgi:DNA-binding HxlR family transcriptional regulator
LSGHERELIEKITHVVGLVQGKWKVELIFLMAHGVRRHGRLLGCLPCASKKAMTDALRALERDGFVSRCVFAEVPMRVEYSLTPLGWAFTAPLMALAEWDDVHSGTVRDARVEYRLRTTSDLAGRRRLPSSRASR